MKASLPPVPASGSSFPVFVTLLASAVAFVLIGLGGLSMFVDFWPKPGEPAKEAPATAGEAPAAPGTTPSADGVVKLEIAADIAQIKFDRTELRAKAGSRISLHFRNPSPLQHNILFGKAGSLTELVNLANALLTDPNAMANGFIPKSDLIFAHSKLLNPGQDETFEFDAPAEPGEYPFLCSFPGHPMLMQGKLILE
jgi:azurin